MPVPLLEAGDCAHLGFPTPSPGGRCPDRQRPAGQATPGSALHLPALAFQLGCGKPDSEAIHRLQGGWAGWAARKRGIIGPRQLGNSAPPPASRHPSTSATGAVSSETGRFPVVSAPFPSATLYCKHRAPLTEARGCPVSGRGRGQTASLLRRETLPSRDPPGSVASRSPVLKSCLKGRGVQAFLSDL